jgi:arylsulfate sulfotransferase
MKMPSKNLLVLVALAALSTAAFAAVKVASLKAKPASPQPIGKSITFTATATDSSAGPVAFQFNVAAPNGALTMAKDFLPGTLDGSTWTGPSFVWVPTGIEGAYQIQVVAKDFATGQSASKTITYVVNALVTGGAPVVKKTANPLVALFSAPSCAAGSTMAAAFQEESGKTPATVTNWVNCRPPASMTFEIAGMYPSTAYQMYAETNTGGTIANGPTITFKTGALPSETIPFPTFTVRTAAPANDPNPVLLHNFITFGTGTIYPDVATDLKGRIIWYNYASGLGHGETLTRPLAGGALTIQNDLGWFPAAVEGQFLRQIDLAGNIVRETNMGAIERELLALGAQDGGPCNAISSPPPVGSACAGAFHHDAIQTLPNGYTAVLINTERIFPAGTQGDTSGLPVDIIGDIIIVLDANWQVVWYWDSFDPNGGYQGYPQLPVTQTAPLGETCGAGAHGCPPMFLLGAGVAPLAHDWLHGNALYYWPAPEDGNATGGDIVWSSRHQDRIFRIDYEDSAGDGRIVWQMGPPDDGLLQAGDFMFINTYNDSWYWYSHQHDVGMENAGAGPLTLFDNGDTRVSPAPLGLGAGCGPYDCDSRGMALTVDQSAMTVTPVVSFDLGAYSQAMGSAELLSSGNYFFTNPIVILKDGTLAYSEEIDPTNPAPQVGPADVVMDVSGPQNYRAWQMPSLYEPPAT